MSSKMEQIIEEIEDYIDGCKPSPISRNKILVNREQLEELLSELRTKTPEEVKRYQKIISNKDAILADAQAKADSIIAEAEATAQEMVSQHEVMQRAYAQANETINQANAQAQNILDAATTDSNNIRLSAISYTDDMLANMSQIMETTLSDAGEKYSIFVNSLKSCYDVVKKNRSELAPQVAQVQNTEASNEELEYEEEE